MPICLGRNLALAFLFGFSLAFTAQTSADVANHHWHRLQQSDGLELYTDISPQSASELLAELAHFDVLVDQFVQPLAEIARAAAPEWVGGYKSSAENAGLTVVVMARRRDFERLFRPSHFTALTLPSLQQTTLVVGPPGARASVRKNLFHEYVHYRLRRDVPGGLPLWFEEGLASYLSQLDWVPVRQELGVTLPSLSDLLERRSLSGMPRSSVQGFYQSSHALVRYLYIESGIEEARLVTALVRDAARFPEAVALDLTGAERAIRGFRETDRPVAQPSEQAGVAQQPLVAPFVGKTLYAETMTVPEVRRVLARAALPINPAAAAKLYAKAARSLPEAVWPLLGQAKALRLQNKTRRADSRLAAAEALAFQPNHAGPSSEVSETVQVLLERAATITTGCIVTPTPACPKAWKAALLELHRAQALDPNSYEVLYRLGIAHLYSGQASAAQGYLQVAWQRAPWSPRINYFFGESLRLERDGRARWYLANAKRWAVSPFYQQAASTGLQRLPDGRDKLLK